MSYTFLKFDFNLAHGQFIGGGNTYSCVGLRSSASIVKAGGLSQGALEFAIYGLPLSAMNQLCTFGEMLTLVGRNTVTVSAGTDPNALSVVYVGNIASAFVDGKAQPEVAFRGEAFTTGDIAVKPTPPPRSRKPRTISSASCTRPGGSARRAPTSPWLLRTRAS